MNIFATMSW